MTTLVGWVHTDPDSGSAILDTEGMAAMVAALIASGATVSGIHSGAIDLTDQRGMHLFTRCDLGIAMEEHYCSFCGGPYSLCGGCSGAGRMVDDQGDAAQEDE